MIDFLIGKNVLILVILSTLLYHPLIGKNTLLLVILSTMLYPHIVNTVASPSHWQKRPLIVVIISTLLHHPLIGKNTLLLVILSIMLYPLIVKNVLLLVTISTLPSGQVWGSRWTKIQGAIFWTYCDVNRCFKGKLN